jgi:hypothetical protein
MHHLNRLPDCIPILEALRIELPQYQTIAQEEVQKPEISRKGKWKFWVANMLTLPNWFLGAEFVALIQPSSGCSERVFAMAISSFDETQTSTLETQTSTVMIRMNNNWKKRISPVRIEHKWEERIESIG